MNHDGLLASVQRAADAGWGDGHWAAVILAAGGPAQPGRTALGLLGQAAAEGGCLFRMANGDAVLLAPAAPSLRSSLEALFSGPSRPLTWLGLPQEHAALLAYAAAIPDAPRPARAERLRRSQAVLLDGDITPCFQEVAPARPGTRLEAADLADVLPQLLAWTRIGQARALHVALTLPALRSAAFPAFVASAEGLGLAVCACVTLLAAVADPDSWRHGRDAARGAGAALALDRVGHGALALIDPGALGPDVVKLVWSPEMIEGGPGLDEALRRIGPGRTVLDAVESETAIRWGRAHGIACFQGRYVDAMLATRRMAACFAADACTVRQCADRAHATGPAERAGCRNPVRLVA